MRENRLLLFLALSLCLALVPMASASQVHLFVPSTNANVVFSGTNTLTQDLVCVNVTLPSGATLNLNGYNIYCSGAVNLLGTINTGNDASTPGSGGTSGGESGYGGFIQGNSINIAGSSWTTAGTGGGSSGSYFGGGGGAGAGSLVFSYGPGGYNSLGASFNLGGGSGGNAGSEGGCPDCSNSGGNGGTTNAIAGSGGSPAHNGNPGTTASTPTFTASAIESMYNNVMRTFLEGGGGGGGATGGSGGASSGTSFTSSYGGSGGGGGGESTSGSGAGAIGGNGLVISYNYNANGNPFIFSNSQTQVIATNTPCTNNWAGGACFGNVTYNTGVGLTNNVTITGNIIFTSSGGVTTSGLSLLADGVFYEGAGSITSGNPGNGGSGGTSGTGAQAGGSYSFSYGGAGGSGGSGASGGSTIGGTPTITNPTLLSWWNGLGLLNYLSGGGGGGGGYGGDGSANGGGGGSGGYGQFLYGTTITIGTINTPGTGGGNGQSFSPGDDVHFQGGGGGGGGGGDALAAGNSITNDGGQNEASGGGGSSGSSGDGASGTGGQTLTYQWSVPPLWVLGYQINQTGTGTTPNTTTILGVTSPIDKVSLYINNIFIANAIGSVYKPINLTDYKIADITPGNDVLTIEDNTWNVSTTEILTFNTIPLVSASLFVNNPVIDSGQTQTLTARWANGTAPFTANYINVTGSKRQALDTGITGFTDTNSFTVFSPTAGNVFTYNVIVSDSSSNVIKANSTKVSFKVNTALAVPTIAASNTVALDTGDYEVFSAVESGGTSPYTYNFLVYNSITNALLANDITTSNSFAWNTAGSGGNTIYGEVIVTDNASTHMVLTSAHTSNIIINPTLTSTSWSVLNPVIDVGQLQSLTANIFGGTQVFTYAYSLYHSSLFQTQSFITSATSNTYSFIEGSTTGTITANVAVSDNAPSVEITTNTLTYTVNPAFDTPTIAPSVNQQYDYGQAITFNAGELGGTTPYTYNFLINSTGGSELANALYVSSSTSNTFIWAFPSADVGNTVRPTIAVTDAATTHATGSAQGAFLKLNPTLEISAVAGITASKTTLYTGQAVNFTAALQPLDAGSSPYTYNFSVYDLANNQILAGNIQYNISGTVDSWTWLVPTAYQGLFVGTRVVVTDSATPPETVNSTLYQFPYPIRVPASTKTTTSSNTISPVVTTTTSPTQQSSNGGLIAGGIVILIIVAGVLYFIGKKHGAETAMGQQ